MEEQFPQFSLSSYFLILRLIPQSWFIDRASILQPRYTGNSWSPPLSILIFSLSIVFFLPSYPCCCCPRKCIKGAAFNLGGCAPKCDKRPWSRVKRAGATAPKIGTNFPFSRKKRERGTENYWNSKYLFLTKPTIFFFYDGKTLLKKSKFQLTQRSSVLITNESNFIYKNSPSPNLILKLKNIHLRDL